METCVIGIAQIAAGEHEQRFAKDDLALLDLRESIAMVGLLQPVAVVRDGERFRLLAGHRRLSACRELGWTEIPAVICECERDIEERVTFAENFFRADLSAIELAVAVAKAYESGRMTVGELAKGFHRSPDWVHRQIAVTQWPDDVLEALHGGGVSVAAAANLALVEEDEYRSFLVQQAVDNGATARTTAAWLQAWRSLLPPSEAVSSQPGPTGVPVQPLIPQAPCLACGQVFRTDALSHVPICAGCVRRIREVCGG